jgi:transposase
MSDLIWLSAMQMRRIEPYFPLSHGVPRVDDREIISGIIVMIGNGLRWRDAPAEYGPPKTICNRFIRWRRLGEFNKIFFHVSHLPRGNRHLLAHLMSPVPRADSRSERFRPPRKKGPFSAHSCSTSFGFCGLFHVDCLTVRIESSADSDLLSFMRLHQILAVDVIARAASVL